MSEVYRCDRCGALIEDEEDAYYIDIISKDLWTSRMRTKRYHFCKTPTETGSCALIASNAISLAFNKDYDGKVRFDKKKKDEKDSDPFASSGTLLRVKDE